MACINTCLLGSGFIGASVLTMVGCTKGKKFKAFNNLLDDNQKTTYAKIKNERLSIYVQGLVIGIILAFLVISMTKMDKNKRVCLFIVIAMGFNLFYYKLYPKSTYMLEHTYNTEQNKAWLAIYKEMKMRHTMGFLLGLVGYYVFANGICK